MQKIYKYFELDQSYAKDERERSRETKREERRKKPQLKTIENSKN